MIAFFSVIHIVALELDDPYGFDASDLPLDSMRKVLWSDIDALSDIHKANIKVNYSTDPQNSRKHFRMHSLDITEP